MTPTTPRPLPLLLLACAILSGCTSIKRLSFSPAAIAQSNRTAFAAIRFSAREPPVSAAATTGGAGVPYTVLALSGGGPDGAYGVGLLAGWSATGRRPVFDVVTGVSTGALMAPFAFLGSASDAHLRELYTGTHISSILKKGSPLRLASGPAIYRSTRLKDLIALNIDDDLLARVAEQHRAGRRLYVATVNIDAQQMLVWDMGAIATRATPEAKALFQQVLLSAVSVPVAFPPQLITPSEPPGALTEAHADATVFAHMYAGAELFPAACKAGTRPCTLYVIVHNKTVAEPAIVPFRSSSMIKRSLETVIKANLSTRLLATAQMARAEGVALRLAYLDVPFEGVSPVDFDLAYMRKVYALGEAAGQRPETWLSAPPKDK
jgi:predicted acylesterase/phospholipase RssA